MCNSTPNVTLQTAVVMVVTDFAQQGNVFSAHDVTKEIRRRCEQGELEIPECEVNGASFRYDLPHPKIRNVFRDLLNTGAFDAICTITSQPSAGGVYMEYTPQGFTGAPAYQTAATPTPVPTPSTPAPAAPSVSTTKASQTDVANRVQIYLDHCKSKSYRPTLKQVQSAIKRRVGGSTGWTCEELRTLIEGNLGYTVVDCPDKESSAQVVV